MKIELSEQDAERIAEIVSAWGDHPVHIPQNRWAHDCADRIRKQVEEARTRKCCANCGVAHCDYRESASDNDRENSKCNSWTANKDAKEEGGE